MSYILAKHTQGGSEAVMAELDDESAQIREVYARFGLAIYLAQCLEHGIVLALLHARLLPAIVSEMKTGTTVSVTEFEAVFDAFMDEQFEQTMGGLISRLKKSASLPTSFLVDLTKARDLRNVLAHSYFRIRAEEFISSVGRGEMLTELDEAHTLFTRVDEELATATNALAERAGTDLTQQERRVADYLSQAYSRAKRRDDAGK